MKSTWFKALFGTFGIACLTACGAGPDPTQSDGEPAASSEALNGTLVFRDDCTATEQSNVTAGFNLVKNLVLNQPTTFTNCLANAVLSGDTSNGVSHVTFPEVIVARLRDNVQTVVSCINTGRSTHGGTTAEGEILFLHRNDINSGASGVANVILHELVHTKGYGHPGPWGDQTQCPGCFEHAAAITHHAPMCLSTGSPQPPLRTTMGTSRELTLAALGVGNQLAASSSSHCHTTGFASGIQGRAAQFVDRLGMTCRDVVNQAVSTAPAFGGGGGTAFSRGCAAGELMVGVWGRAGAFVDSVGPICSTETNIRNGVVQNIFRTKAGGAGGLAFTRRCPAFQAVKRFKLRHASFVEQLDVVCQDIRTPRSVDTTLLSSLGGTGGGWLYNEECPSRSVMDSLLTVHGANGIERLGGQCSVVSNNCAGCTVTVSGTATDHLMPLHGGPSNENHFTENPLTASVDRCPGTNSVLVGVQVWTSGWIQGIRGVCTTNATNWSAGITTTLTNTPIRGNATGTSSSARCAAGRFLVGWEVATGQFVDRLRPICRLL